ncbi:C-N hydrolase family amidase [Roseovarius albus]|uniref:C-N hydrolase family amidase n=1 Tax=Roseovarius albus TaxID=1247867 RepID=A0A1X6ZH61_9RHOB|nr:carbon-nitrogen hydrolase family protein [Roseovarius albus]SLN51341.1 C-N hydrolase family amidase [Roseovarius albus]
MKVTVCQLDPRGPALDDYLQGLKQHVKEQETDFLLLPEMGFSDWLAADAIPDANRWNQAVEDHDRHIANLSNFGARAVMGTRPIIKSNGSRRNLAYLWSADTAEAAAVHEKYYLPDEEGYWEHSWYDRGHKSFDLGRALDMRIGVQICTEMWFFEWARHYGASRADLLCVPRATPHGSTDKWLAGGQAVAVCSGAYCLSSNLWAPEGEKLNAGGLGWIVDPEGEILATTSVEQPFATAEIDLGFARHSKTTYPRYVPE